MKFTQFSLLLLSISLLASACDKETKGVPDDMAAETLPPPLIEESESSSRNTGLPAEGEELGAPKDP